MSDSLEMLTLILFLQESNREHAGFCVAVEWGIFGLKCKFKGFFDSRPNRIDKFELIFSAAAIFTNFSHHRMKDYSASMKGEGNGEGGEWTSILYRH